MDLTGAILGSRTDAAIDFAWTSSAPVNGGTTDGFSVRWSGQLAAPVSGTYTLGTLSDNGIRLWLDGRLLIDKWDQREVSWDQSVPVTLAAGQKYDIQIEHFGATDGETRFYWTYPGQTEQVVGTNCLYPTGGQTVQKAPQTRRSWLSGLPFLKATGSPLLNKSVVAKTLTLGGHKYSSGVGVNAPSEILVALDDRFDVFKAVIGIDDAAATKGSAVFEVWLDGVLKYTSGVRKGGSGGLAIEVPLEGALEMRLVVSDGGDGTSGDYADWADARLEGVATLTYVSALTWKSAANGLGPVELDQTNGGAAAGDGKTLTLRGQAYRKGLGTYSNAAIVYALGRRYERLSGVVGIDDAAAGAGSAVFEAWSGATLLFRSAKVMGASAPVHFSVNVQAVDELTLKVLDAGDGTAGDMADWADLKLMALGSDIPTGVVPGAPTNLKAAPGDQQVILTWTAAANGVSYKVYRSTTAGTTGSQIASNVMVTTYTDTGRVNGTKYYYKVAALNPNGQGPLSNEVAAMPVPATVPAVPLSLTATAGNAKVTLAWQAATGAVSYSVLRGTASGGESATPLVAGLKVLAHTDSAVTNGTKYFYKVLAVNARGNSPASNEASATPMAPVVKPVAPTALTATAGNNRVTLAWTGSAGATSYNVYRGATAGGEATTPVFTGVAASPFIDTTAANGSVYFYKVTALNSAGESGRSNEAYAEPSAPTTADPQLTAAWRLLRQSSWGAKPGEAEAIRNGGRAAYLAAQFNATPSVFPDTLYNQSVEYTQEHLYRLALEGPDQLRLRVMWALHQIWVVSAADVKDGSAIVNYLRVLQGNSFGNYRTLMDEMTLNPAMGRYLNMVNNKSQQSTGVAANENYAREILQLFTLGLPKLASDGTPLVDGQGQTVPAYTETDVKELARVFTGWTYGDGNPAVAPTKLTSENYKYPMEPVEKYHDTGAKTVLGVAFPAGQTARQDLKLALDTIFQHPNVEFFVTRELIQRLVTSNPSAAYKADIAAVFRNNGANVRGDLKAVVEAILTHPDAALPAAPAGKLMEPALFITSQLRALNATVTDHPFMSDLSADMGQNVLYPPSVFNYYSPNFRIRGTALYGPEYQILTSVTALERANFVATLLSGGFGSAVAIDYTGLRALAPNGPSLVDAVNTLLFGGTMSAPYRQAVLDAVQSLPPSSVSERVKTALYLSFVSAQYQTDH